MVTRHEVAARFSYVRLWIRANPQLSSLARDWISRPDSDVFVSVAAAWEIAIKVGLNRWPEATSLLGTFEAGLVAEGFSLLPISVEHARRSGLMTHPHRDPFDRLLAAQAIAEGMKLVTADAKLSGLGAPTLW